jgi:hypothetical protein
MLTTQKREQLEQYEAQGRCLGEYMQASTDFNTRAAVALFLSEMAENMSALPGIYREMQTMRVSMAAVPAMVAEMRAINATLAVIAATMDSTMGCAGRSFGGHRSARNGSVGGPSSMLRQVITARSGIS